MFGNWKTINLKSWRVFYFQVANAMFYYSKVVPVEFNNKHSRVYFIEKQQTLLFWTLLSYPWTLKQTRQFEQWAMTYYVKHSFYFRLILLPFYLAALGSYFKILIDTVTTTLCQMYGNWFSQTKQGIK